MKTSLLTLFLLGFSINFSIAQQINKFEHSFWEWVQGSKISENKLDEIAPHFPIPSNYEYNVIRYDQAIQKWQKLYCFEYEKLINTPELVKLNPYYDGYIDIIQMPYFILPLESSIKPVKPSSFQNFEEELHYELQLQAWYFVFAPNDFYRIYKIKPEFPSWFDPETYRKNIIKKIEDNK
jgi:hypothetical protein